MNSYEASNLLVESCNLCPHLCGCNRLVGSLGVCRSSADLKVARASLHFWEEPPVSGTRGSGTIFFCGCNLCCVYCQNHEISRGRTGKIITIERLSDIMLELQTLSAHNINLVTPTHMVHAIIPALKLAKKKGLHLPVVYNTSGYERAEVIQEIAKYVDVWLTDFKYASGTLSKQLSSAPNYPQYACESLKVMFESFVQKGGRQINEEGIYTNGLIVRHLILPGQVKNSFEVLDLLWETVGNEIDLSLMNQYTPNAQCLLRKDSLNRPVRKDEYKRVLNYASDLGFSNIWWQEEGTQSESFIPPFDLTGV